MVILGSNSKKEMIDLHPRRRQEENHQFLNFKSRLKQQKKKRQRKRKRLKLSSINRNLFTAIKDSKKYSKILLEIRLIDRLTIRPFKVIPMCLLTDNILLLDCKCRQKVMNGLEFLLKIQNRSRLKEPMRW